MAKPKQPSNKKSSAERAAIERSVERPFIGPMSLPKPVRFTEATLGSGLRVVVVRRPGVPLVELRLGFRLTAKQISAPAAPLVMSESLFAGSAVHDRSGFAEATERIGGSLGASLSGDCLVIGGSSLATKLRDLLGLLSEVLTSATYPADEVSADRARTADEVLVMLSRPEVVADEALSARVFGEHPYSAPLPRPESLERVTGAALRKLHPAVVAPANAELVLVGDIQPARAIGLVEQQLGQWASSSGTKAASLAKLPAIAEAPVQLVHRPGSVQSNIRLGAPALSRSDAGWPALALANEIFGTMFTSRLVDNLRERHGYTYSPRSSVAHRRAGSSLTVVADVSSAVTAAAVVEIAYELGRIATTGVLEEELEAARSHATGAYLIGLATQAGLASTLVALGLAGFDPSYLSTFPAAMARVKKQEVDEVAARILGPRAFATVIVGDAETVAGQLGAVADVEVSAGS